MVENELFSLDRIEENQAVLIADNGVSCIIPLHLLPAGACAGKMYRRVGETFVEDADAEQARRQEIHDLQNRLRRRKT